MNSGHSHKAECAQCEWAVTADFNPLRTCCWDLSAVHLPPIHHCLHPHRKGHRRSIPSIIWNPPNGLQQMTAIVISADTGCLIITSIICTYRGEINSRHNDLHKDFIDTKHRLGSAGWWKSERTVRTLFNFKHAKHLYRHREALHAHTSDFIYSDHILQGCVCRVSTLFSSTSPTWAAEGQTGR